MVVLNWMGIIRMMRQLIDNRHNMVKEGGESGKFTMLSAYMEDGHASKIVDFVKSLMPPHLLYLKCHSTSNMPSTMTPQCMSGFFGHTSA